MMHPDAEELARFFHDEHDRRRSIGAGRQRARWEDSPDEYRDRLTGTFDALLRAGIVHAGAKAAHRLL